MKWITHFVLEIWLVNLFFIFHHFSLFILISLVTSLEPHWSPWQPSYGWLVLPYEVYVDFGKQWTFYLVTFFGSKRCFYMSGGKNFHSISWFKQLLHFGIIIEVTWPLKLRSHDHLDPALKDTPYLFHNFSTKFEMTILFCSGEVTGN